MDCVIPGHSVRLFCASIGCLSRVGKDLYVEFDAIDGLAFRTLNDAKSAYACFRYVPSFFERCTSPPPARKRSEPSQEMMRFSCRVPLRSLVAVVRPRKAVVALRIRSEISSSVLYLSFEFQIRNQDALLTVVHRMKVAEANGLSAVAPTDGSSEIVASPRVLLRLLEPLRNTVEAALIIRSDMQAVSASSFHHTDTATDDADSNNAILKAASAAILKTETAIGCNEFEEFDFREDREIVPDDDTMPENVNREVILVFSVKEARALLLFCSQAHLDQDLRASLFFQWGGKPMVFRTSTETFSAQLVLSTLDFKLLTSLLTEAGTATADKVNQ
jgi:hypothetical protein